MHLTELLLALLEKLVGRPLFVENRERELYEVDRALREAVFAMREKGIIREWSPLPSKTDCPPLQQARITLSPVTIEGKTLRLDSHYGEGSGESFNDASRKAFAEALERYCLCAPSLDCIHTGTFYSLRKYGAIDPATFIYAPRNDEPGASLLDQEFGWVAARSLNGSQHSLVPAQAAYITWPVIRTQEPKLCETTSNGSAAGTSYDDAAYRALCEAIERDAFLLHWLWKRTPPRLRIKSIPSQLIQKRAATLHRYGIELHLLDITSDLEIPVYAAVLVDYFGGKAVCVSAAAGHDRLAALEKLTLEAVKQSHHPARRPVPPEKVRSFRDRAALWGQVGMIQHIAFLLAGHEQDYTGGPVTPSQHAGLQHIVDVFTKKGHPCYLVDITNSYARELGLHVVKAVTPSLVPLYAREDEKPLNVRRLQHCPLGAEPVAGEVTLNEMPHPFL